MSRHRSDVPAASAVTRRSRRGHFALAAHVALIVLSLGVAPNASAQTAAQSSGKLKDLLPRLFSFGDCGEPLCLAGSANAENGHGSHFIGSAVGTNSTIINFLTEAVGAGLSNIPISAANSGVTFSFEGGRPVRTATSAGPVFGERAQTLGRNRVLFGANVTGLNYTTLRGRPLRDLNFTFTHQNVADTEYGNPEFENETIDVNLSLDLNLIVSTFYMTWGVLDNVDLSVAVPWVYSSMRASSVGQINPFGPSAPHYFAGDATNPVLGAVASVDGSASGIGDVAARMKWNLSRTPRFGLSLLADGRFATGDEENLLGAGASSVRGLLIASTQMGTFAPHLNAGYVSRSGEFGADGVLATLGFDQLVSSWATLAADLITETPVGNNAPPLPSTVTFDVPFRRTIEPTDIPNTRDRYASLSLGMKFTTSNGVQLLTNVIAPLQRAGLQSDAIWTFGLEKAF
jgi:hypothetical protein